MKYTLLLLFFLSSTTVFAQPTERLEKFKAMKIAFITDMLDLSPKEAQNFWPIYNKYITDSEIIRNKQRFEYRQNIKKEEKLSKTADNIAEKFVSSFLLAEEKQLELKKNLAQDLKPHISYQKVWRLIRAENEFKKKMISEFKKRRENRRDK